MPFLVLVISLCKAKFLYDIFLCLKPFLEHFLQSTAMNVLIFCFSEEKQCLFFFNFWNTFSQGFRFWVDYLLVCLFFFSNVKDMTQLPSRFHSFLKKYSNSSLPSLVYRTHRSSQNAFSLSYVFQQFGWNLFRNVLRREYLLSLMFSEPPGSVIFTSFINLGKLLAIISLNVSSALCMFSFASWTLTQGIWELLTLSHSSESLSFVLLFIFCVSIGWFLLTYLQACWFFP